MLTAVKIAGYIADRYRTAFGKEIDEMKLHKLLYFFVRECYVASVNPKIEVSFEARQYGPVSAEVRDAYKRGLLHTALSQDEIAGCEYIIDEIFDRYAPKNSWSLSSITHGEQSWINARNRYQQGLTAAILPDDIRKDASRIRLRRYLINGDHA